MKYNLLIYVSLLIQFSCNPENRITKYYYSNKEEINEIKSISFDLVQNYNFEYVSVMKMDTRIRVSIHDDNPYKGTANFYNTNSLKPDPIDNGNSICDSCTPVEVTEYKKFMNDSCIKKVMVLYKKIKPRAIKIIPDGVFFAIDKTIRSKNWSGSMEGGVFVPFAEKFDKANVVGRIDDEGAYLYESIVR